MDNPSFPAPRRITWKHVVTVIAVTWLLVTLIGGESLKVGSFELHGMGCSLHTTDFQRSVAGLSAKPAGAKVAAPGR